jgi:hypothetical protein
MALRSAGYCEACEYMTTEQVLRLLMIARSTVIRMAQRGELHRGGEGRALYHRADVERLSHSRRFAS